jgi:TDG/mug DNA glycosylase family protein
MLPDVLRPGLRLVICGSAAGAVSAARGAYYAGPGNRFWPILAEVGLTPRLLQPDEFATLPIFGIGLTDMAKVASGSDAELPVNADDVAGFRQRIAAVRPRMVAFNGKRAAAVFYGVRGSELAYGPGKPVADFPPVWILPSTSGAASGSWDPLPWRRMADAVLLEGSGSFIP